jgi:hypothetical protein
MMCDAAWHMSRSKVRGGLSDSAIALGIFFAWRNLFSGICTLSEYLSFRELVVGDLNEVDAEVFLYCGVSKCN